MRTIPETPKKERDFGTWGLMAFVLGLITVMVLLYLVKRYFFS